MGTHRFREEPVELYLDHYRLAGTGIRPRAWLMVVHGGAWRGGSRKEHAGFNRAFAALGVDVIAVDYRLAPAWRYPQPLEDLAAALEWIGANAAMLGLDPGAGHVLGRSAGGQLALQLAYGEAGRRLRLAVALYAPADMVHAGTAPFNRRVLDARAVLRDYLGRTWAEDPSRYAAASPLLAVRRSDLPPTLLLHGPDDAIVAFEHKAEPHVYVRGAAKYLDKARNPWVGAWSGFESDSVPYQTMLRVRLHAALPKLENSGQYYDIHVHTQCEFSRDAAEPRLALEVAREEGVIWPRGSEP